MNTWESPITLLDLKILGTATLHLRYGLEKSERSFKLVGRRYAITGA